MQIKSDARKLAPLAFKGIKEKNNVKQTRMAELYINDSFPIHIFISYECVERRNR